VILDDTKIKELNLVHNATESLFRSASYDLTIGSIITADGEVVSEHALAPQGIVKVISQETVDMPADITGYVHVKTQLCNEGVLTLNIGIVDPCFKGPLQSTVLNFGKNIYRLHKGAVFGRITFHQQICAGKKTVPVERSMTQVVQDAQSHMDRYLANDFLNFSNTVKRASEEAAGKLKLTLFVFVPALALMLAGITYFLNFSNMARLESYINVKDRAADMKRQEDTAATVVELARKNDALEAEVKSLQSKAGKDASPPAAH
jgi:dUTPase